MAIDYRYNYSNEELLKDWYALQKTTVFKTGAQFKPGMKLCQHFFPNFWDIQNNKGKSFADCWNDPIIMDKVRKWGLKGMSQLWLSWVRRAVFMAAGLPNSSFYRPHFSRQIILRTNKSHGTLFDPCAGWGGRLLGTVSAGWRYIGCESNVETFENLTRMVEFLGIDSYVELHNIPAEDFKQSKVDVVLTSPPYFNLETYSDSLNQSYNKHKNYDGWKNLWLQPLIEDSLSNINRGGISAWNVMKVGKFDLVEDVISIHANRGWKLVDSLGFQSPLNNIRKLKNKDVTYLFELD